MTKRTEQPPPPTSPPASALNAPLGGTAQPPPPATGMPARTLAEELREAVRDLAPATQRLRDERDTGYYSGFDRALECVDALLANHPALRQPAPVAADVAGQGERRWGVLFEDQVGKTCIFEVCPWSEDGKEDARRWMKYVASGVGNRNARISPILLTELRADDAAPAGAEGAKTPTVSRRGRGEGEREPSPLSPDELNAALIAAEEHMQIEDRDHTETLLRLATAEARGDKLQAFKDYVHKRLDDAGVPHHPPGPHGAAGCRVGDRMDWLLGRFAFVEQMRSALEWYADAGNYNDGDIHAGDQSILLDGGTRARAALAPPAGGAAGRDGGA